MVDWNQDLVQIPLGPGRFSIVVVLVVDVIGEQRLCCDVVHVSQPTRLRFILLKFTNATGGQCVVDSSVLPRAL